jgi:hypothetical protein
MNHFVLEIATHQKGGLFEFFRLIVLVRDSINSKTAENEEKMRIRREEKMKLLLSF